MSEFNNAEKLVTKILTENPECRNSDKELQIKAWEHQGLYLTPSQKNIFRQTISTETIRRTRQKLQEQGLFQPTTEVKKARQQQEMQYHTQFTLNWQSDGYGAPVLASEDRELIKQMSLI